MEDLHIVKKIREMSGAQARIALRFLWLLLAKLEADDGRMNCHDFEETLDIALTYK